MAQAQNGDKVSVHYRGTFEDGEEFDSSAGRDPLEFTIGGQEVIEGMNKAVLGMEVGEKKTVTIPPEEAYGPRHEEASVKVDPQQLPEGVEVGAMLGLSTPEGQFHAVLVELGEDYAVLDANHPMAGKALTFELELIKIG